MYALTDPKSNFSEIIDLDRTAAEEKKIFLLFCSILSASSIVSSFHSEQFLNVNIYVQVLENQAKRQLTQLLNRAVICFFLFGFHFSL